MPHKINPKNFENVKSLWKAFMPRMVTVYMDQLSEHQRDLTSSASQRFFGELVAMLYYACRRLTSAFKQTQFNTASLAANFKDAGQWIIAEPLFSFKASNTTYACFGRKEPRQRTLRRLEDNGVKLLAAGQEVVQEQAS